MEKDPSIIQFIERLRLLINVDAIEIVDHWDADLCAIGLAKGSQLVYVSTYSYVDLPVIKYYFELETSTGDRPDQFIVSRREADVSEVDLVKVIQEFLGV